MVKIEPFAVEKWMDRHETKAQFNLAETCCASISVDDLQEISDRKDSVLKLSAKLTYGAIRGSDTLRSNLARLYSSKVGTPLPADNVLITPGAIAANHLVFYSLVGPGDHVVCHYPTYQQLYSVPASLGADVDLWKARPEAKWVPAIDDLKALVKPNTKLIVINNPNNPTGAVLGKALLQKVVDFAETKNITVLADEVYRPIFHSITPMDREFPPSILSLGYRNTIATGSMSKAYSLAGIRVGWIASRNPEIIEKCADARDYTTISVSQLDEQVAAFALDPNTIHNLLGRNLKLAKTNLELLDRFMIKHDDICEWVRPLAGTTAFIRFHRDGEPIHSSELCEKLLESSGVFIAPGDECFGEEFKGYVRIGYIPETETLKNGLDKFRIFLRKEFDDLRLSQ